MRYNTFSEFQNKSNLRIFSKSDVETILKLNPQSAKVLINRYVKKGLFIKIKNGLYFSKDFIPSSYSISAYLLKPSYISLESALSEHGLIPEIVYSITCVTTKTTNEFDVNGILYTYKSIKTKAFTGYFKKDNYYLAKPEKAVADYLYFISLGRIVWNDRLNLQKVDKKEVIKYAELFDSKSLNKWIKENYDRQTRNTEKIY